jgi:hypothetical protein
MCKNCISWEQMELGSTRFTLGYCGMGVNQFCGLYKDPITHMDFHCNNFEKRRINNE